MKSKPIHPLLLSSDDDVPEQKPTAVRDSKKQSPKKRIRRCVVPTADDPSPHVDKTTSSTAYQNFMSYMTMMDSMECENVGLKWSKSDAHAELQEQWNNMSEAEKSKW